MKLTESLFIRAYFLGLICFCLLPHEALGGGVVPAGDSNKGVEITFVLSARELPELLFSKKPEAEVEVTYFRSPDQPPDYYTNKTRKSEESFNPEWPDVFQITFFEGHQQKLRFVVKQGREEIGKVIVSVLEISKAKGGRLEKDIIGKNPTNGRLIIFFVMNKSISDDTDARLIEPSEQVKVLKRIVETIDKK